MSHIKKTAFVLILTLLSAILMPTAAFGASSGDYTVENVSYKAELRMDGSAVVTEDWNVSFSENATEGFVREITISEDEFERIGAISDLSVSVDGSICSEESSDSLRRGVYSLTKTENAYIIKWYMPENGGTHSFSLRYAVKDAVKLYHEQAYFSFCIVNKGDRLLCRNITAVVTTPTTCFSEDFEILESGSLAGEKADGKITFSCVNSVGEVKARVRMPAALFDAGAVTQIIDDTTGMKIAVSVISAILIIIAIVLIYCTVMYKRLFRKHWLKKCRTKPREADSVSIFHNVFSLLSPARVLHIVSGKTLNPSDFFTVTFLELVKRGYITAEKNGFAVAGTSENDWCRRPLDKNEKRLLNMFSSDKWQAYIRRPLRFYKEVEAFNKNIGFVSPFFMLSKKGKELISDCFEIRISAKRFEFITPMEISDSFFRNEKYSIGDLVTAVINEYDRYTEFGHDDSTSAFKYNMFMFRDVYDEGKAIFEKNEQKRKNKKRGD